MVQKFSPDRADEYYQESYEKIESCLETIDVKPFSDTLIGIKLRIVADKLGKEKANQLIDELGLESYGWKKKE